MPRLAGVSSLVFVLLASACTVGGGGEVGGAEAAGATASDRGVTAEEIRLGVLTMREDTFSRFGFTYEGKKVERVLAPFVDEINGAGGIHGRKLVAKVSRYNPLSQDDMQAACVEQAEDHRVFAAISPPGFWGDAQVCMAAERTPLLAADASSLDALERRSEGWVRQTVMSKDRIVKNWIDWLVERGDLGPETRTGVVYTEVPEDRQLVNDVLVPYMLDRGLAEPTVGTFTLGTPESAAIEAGSSVLRFKRAGVELVLPVTNFLQMFLWLRAAEDNAYRPRYSATDIGLLATNATSFYQPAQWEGVEALTVFQTGGSPPGELPNHPAFRKCLDVYRAHREEIGPSPDDPAHPDGLEIVNVAFVCEHVALFAEAARGAGPGPTREAYLDAFSAIGEWSERVTMTERLAFSEKKFDGADLLAAVRWRGDCTADSGCYERVEPFRPGNH